MPYFLYMIDPQKKMTCLGSHSGYRDAKQEVRHLRESAEDTQNDYRMIFANNENEAEHLLSAKREEPIQGDD